MADGGHRNPMLQKRLLALAVLIVAAAVIGFIVNRSSSSNPPASTSTSTSTSTSGGACTKGGSCGYESVSPAEALLIIAEQSTGPGSLKNCTPTSGEVAALKGTGSSEWDCTNVQSGAVATYTINADGSVDY